MDRQDDLRAASDRGSLGALLGSVAPFSRVRCLLAPIFSLQIVTKLRDGSAANAILDRASLEEIGYIGGPGRKAGEFLHLHSLGVDPNGNLVTGESQGYRVQKFIDKGLSTTATR